VTPIRAAIQTLPPAIQPVVDAVAFAIEPVFNAITLAIQVLVPVFKAVGLSPFGPAIEPVIDALALDIQALIDAVTPAVQTIFDPISGISGKGGAHAKEQDESGCKKGRGFHVLFS